MTLLYCYKRIPITSASEVSYIYKSQILRKKNMNDIDSMTQINRDLLNIENWEEEYQSRDPNELELEIRDIQERLEDLNKKVLNK